MKLNFEHLFELATLEIDALGRMQFVFWWFLNTIVCEFTSFNFGTVRLEQSDFFSRWTGGKMKILLTFFFKTPKISPKIKKNDLILVYGTVNAIQKKCLATRNGRNQKFTFINAIAVSLFLFIFKFIFIINLQLSFLFQHVKEGMKTYILLHMFLSLQPPTIFYHLLPSSCFQQYFHD